MRHRPLSSVVVLVLAACASHEPTPRRRDAYASLLDSVATATNRRDTVAAAAALKRAGALVPGDPARVLPFGAAAERLGDVATAAWAYRWYLTDQPNGRDAATIRARLTALVGTPPTGIALSGTTHSAADSLSDPVVAAVTVAPPPATSLVRRAHHLARTTTVATVTSPAAAPVAAPVEVATPADTIAPRLVVVMAAESTSAVSVASNGTVAPARPRIRYSRWSRMQRWFVAKVAAAGGAGGVVVGALVGNVPGAIAVGLASGAAGGLAKVHRDKVDSARALRDSVPPTPRSADR